MTESKPIQTSALAPAACPVCGNGFEKGRHAWLFRCDECKLLASSLQPDIPQFATSTPLDEESRLAGLYSARRRSNHVILDTLARNLHSTQRHIVDIGCGHGLFIKDALERGFRAEGVEPDANVVDQARAQTGAPVRHGFFPDALSPADSYDAIIFNDVLEHIPSVVEALAACDRHLNPGGILVLNCPDQNGIFYRIADVLDRFGARAPFLRMWQYGLPSPHVWYFGAEHLVRLGRNAGLDNIHIARLKPITWSGLYARVSYVEGQSRVLNTATLLAASILLPFLSILPKDTSIVFLRKSFNDK